MASTSAAMAVTRMPFGPLARLGASCTSRWSAQTLWPRLCGRAASSNATSMRTHTCGELGTQHSGRTVTVCGWVQQIRDFGDNLAFLTLRDAYGVVQVTVNHDALQGQGPHNDGVQGLRHVSSESVVSITGQVQDRPAETVNTGMATGAIEVLAQEASVLNAAAVLPFQITAAAEQANEPLRQKYRYLDLRRHQLQQRIRLRSTLAMATRNHLVSDHAFVEVETPTLFKRTPGGAAEFPVPTQTPGQFYTLVQSPQQFKQLLMVGGYDRYFQMARCYRDEGGRGDRQPEFTQIDLEMSFATQSDIEAITESLVTKLWKEGLGIELQTPFKRMPYRQAMAQYGVDKPDTRYGMLLHDVGACFQPDTGSGIIRGVLDAGGTVLGIKLDQASAVFNKKASNALQDHVRGLGWKGVIVVHVRGAGEAGQACTWSSPIAKHVSAEETAAINEQFGAVEGDVLILSAGTLKDSTNLMGKLRTYGADVLEENGAVLRDPATFNFLWVDEFPLFEESEDDLQAGDLGSSHHIFTAPRHEDVHLLDSDPLQVRGQHMDLVLNGVELGGGSVRCHEPSMQRKVIDIVQEDPRSFSHIIEALSYGAPPHGGIALGFDRLMMIMAGAQSLRDVIAFPKSFAGKDLMGGAPDVLPQDYLDLYHIDCQTNAAAVGKDK